MIKNWRPAALAVSLALGAPGCRREVAEGPTGYQGVVELDERVLGFELGGRIQEVPVRRGVVVQQGARLAALDPSLEQTLRTARASELDLARAQLSLLKAGSRWEDVRGAEAQVRAARATEDLLSKNLEREKALRERGASTDALVEDLQGRLDRSVAERQALEQKVAGLRRGSRAEELSAAEARVAVASAALKLEDERIERHVLTAPLGGIVQEVHLDVGEVVAPGTPVVTIADTMRPYADVFVPEGELGGLAPGVVVHLRVDAEAAPFTGAVETIATKTEFTPRYLFSDRERPNLVVRVRVRIEDPEGRLHAGVPTFATFEARGGGTP